MKKLCIILTLALSLCVAIPAIAVEITGLVFSEELAGEYGIWKPVTNQFRLGDSCFVIVPFKEVTMITEPLPQIGIEAFLTLIAPDGTKVYDNAGTGLYDKPSPTFDPERATFYVELNMLPWLPPGEYIIEIVICDHLNDTASFIQATFYISALPKDC